MGTTDFFFKAEIFVIMYVCIAWIDKKGNSVSFHINTFENRQND